MAPQPDDSISQPTVDLSGKVALGWREWVALPELGIDRIKAKVDTGARTSCLHTFRMEPYEQDGERRVRFWVHPIQHDLHTVIECDAAVIDERMVSDSGGHREMRLVIQTGLLVGDTQWPVEMTLTNRDSMRFRMLIGRTAMAGRSVVLPEASYLAGEPAVRTKT
ncbi:MAG: ATP-dependent zinc protease [Marinobacter sp.]|uniref:ATP-dependent zinc protease family protein n=1 Tax=Marinobacter sp. TaxID=50741 RepID=UPI00299E1565|nr:ATP-dependent zinc protease [Marinobacter sp.]MDX1633510.1 ATP-dependent zinc protease [Marinobacter sp.]